MRLRWLILSCLNAVQLFLVPSLGSPHLLQSKCLLWGFRKLLLTSRAPHSKSRNVLNSTLSNLQPQFAFLAEKFTGSPIWNGYWGQEYKRMLTKKLEQVVKSLGPVSGRKRSPSFWQQRRKLNERVNGELMCQRSRSSAHLRTQTFLGSDPSSCSN